MSLNNNKPFYLFLSALTTTTNIFCLTKRLFYLFIFIFIFLKQQGINGNKNAPPELLPLEGQQSPIRIALGTKGFKLSCPVRTNSEKEWLNNNQQNNEENLENELIIKWNKDERPLEIIESNNRHFRLSNENRDLWILQAKIEDSGLFRCTAINEWGHQSVEFQLVVFDPTNTIADIVRSSEISAPTWNEPLGPLPIQIRVNKGKHIQIQCPNAHGNPLPKLNWLRLNGHSEQDLGQMSYLSFNRVHPQDAGIYACRLENNLGAIRADFSLQIVEEEESEEKIFKEGKKENNHLPIKGSISSLIPSHIGAAAVNVIPPSTPLINVVHGQQQFHVGNTVELQCRVEWRGERDKTVIRWLRQLDNSDVNALRARAPSSSVLKLGQISLLMIEQEDEPVRVEKSAMDGQKYFLNELRIKNMQKEDSGRYFCVVTNPAGQFVYRSVNLSVINSNSYISSSYALLNFYLSQSPFVRAFILCLLGFLIIGCILIIGWLFCIRICNNKGIKQKFFEKKIKGKNGQNNNNSLSSSSSTSATATGTNNSTKISNIQINSINCTNNNKQIQYLNDIYNNSNFLPPPPRIPPPILPSFSSNNKIVEWPSSVPMQQQTSTLERYKIMRQPQMLHRTKADDEDMSKISSHIYASGSPLPLTINSRISNNKQHNFNKINNSYINKEQNINVNKIIEEQRRPLIEAYSQQSY